MSRIDLDSMGLIYDRTQTDLDNGADKAYIDYTDLNRIESAIYSIGEKTGAKFSTSKKTWKMSEYRTEAQMERLRNNLQVLQNSYYLRDGRPSLPDKITYTTISQANDIEHIIYDIGDTYNCVEAGKRRLSFKLGAKRFGNGTI